MTLSSAEIKRQILISAGNSDIKKRMDKAPPGISEGEQIEIGNNLEALTRMKGWTLVESYMMRRMNLVGLVLSAEEDKDKDQKGVARGFIELMQWIELMIRRRDEIIEKETKAYAKAQSVSEDEGSET